MTPWSPLMCTTPFAPRTAPGHLDLHLGEAVVVGHLGDLRVIEHHVAAASAQHARRTRVHRNRADFFERHERERNGRAAAAQIDAHVALRGRRISLRPYTCPAQSGGNAKCPCASVVVLTVRLLPVAVTSRRATGCPSCVTVPERNAFALAARDGRGPPSHEGNKNESSAQIAPRRRWHRESFTGSRGLSSN